MCCNLCRQVYITLCSTSCYGYDLYLINFLVLFFFFQLPEKLLYSQGCNWIQQYSFGPERYTGPNAFGKLRKCMETLKTNVSI